MGVVQYAANEDIEGNYEKAKMYIKECSEKGAQMVCLPEHFAYMSQKSYIKGGHLLQGFDEKIGGPLFNRYR